MSKVSVNLTINALSHGTYSAFHTAAAGKPTLSPQDEHQLPAWVRELVADYRATSSAPSLDETDAYHMSLSTIPQRVRRAAGGASSLSAADVQQLAHTPLRARLDALLSDLGNIEKKKSQTGLAAVSKAMSASAGFSAFVRDYGLTAHSQQKAARWIATDHNALEAGTFAEIAADDAALDRAVAELHAFAARVPPALATDRAAAFAAAAAASAWRKSLPSGASARLYTEARKVPPTQILVVRAPSGRYDVLEYLA